MIRLAVAIALLTALAGCANKPTAPPPGAAQPDRFLFDRGNESLKEEEWVNARTYFQQVVDNYPQSPVRPDAKLGMGDAYLGEGNTESLVLAANEFREFLTFYPTSPRADYAQYKLAMSHFRQMRAAERDQTETAAALKEFDVFFQRYPNSPLTPEVKQNWRIARDRLSDSELRVGVTYARIGVLRGAALRFQALLKEDPNFTHRDEVYYQLAEIYLRSDNKAQAIPFYQRVVDEFTESEFLEKAQKRLKELNAK